MVTLDDLPDRRRDALLWRYALTMDYQAVDAQVRERSTRPCGPGWLGQAGERVAVFGDDDRYHLLIDGEPICAKPQKSIRRGHQRFLLPTPVWRHDHQCHWWTDGNRYRIWAPYDAARDHDGLPAGSGDRDVAWTVALTAERAVPGLVPRSQRCPINEPTGQWPLPERPDTALGRVRIQLAEALGADCHACRCGPGVLVDHDPFSTYVRGLLCRHCNTTVDTCPHLAGCLWADYLNDPPAAPLKLVYPLWRQVLRHQSTQRKIDMLGIDPFSELRGR